MNWIFSTLFLLAAFALTLRTHRREGDSSLAFLAFLFGLLVSIEILTIHPGHGVLLLVLWTAFGVVGVISVLVLIRKSLTLSSKTAPVMASSCLFLAIAGVGIFGRRSVPSSNLEFLVAAVSLLAFSMIIVLDQKLNEHTDIRAELNRQREFSEKLVNTSRDGVLAVNRADQITLWNPAMELVTGITSPVAIGKQSSQVLRSIFPDSRDNPIAEALLGPEIVRVWRVRSSSKPERERVFKGYFSPMRGPSGEVLEILAVVTEIHEHPDQPGGPCEGKEEVTSSHAETDREASVIAS